MHQTSIVRKFCSNSTFYLQKITHQDSLMSALLTNLEILDVLVFIVCKHYGAWKCMMIVDYKLQLWTSVTSVHL